MKYGRIFLISDTHLGHDKMPLYCGRPENHSELILLGLRKNLRDDDILIHLGDVCIGNDEAWHYDLAGYLPKVKRFLIQGNHDKKSDSWYLRHGWDFVAERFDNTYFGKKIAFSHQPIPDGDYDMNIHGHFHNNLHRLLKGEYIVEAEKERNMIPLSLLTPKHKLFAIENTNYQPVLLDNFIKK